MDFIGFFFAYSQATGPRQGLHEHHTGPQRTSLNTLIGKHLRTLGHTLRGDDNRCVKYKGYYDHVTPLRGYFDQVTPIHSTQTELFGLLFGFWMHHYTPIIISFWLYLWRFL